MAYVLPAQIDRQLTRWDRQIDSQHDRIDRQVARQDSDLRIACIVPAQIDRWIRQLARWDRQLAIQTNKYK